MPATPTLRTGRLTTRVASYMAAILTGVLASAQLLGLTQAMTFTLVESVAILGGAVMLGTEIFFEGRYKGLTDREYSVSELLGAGLVIGAALIGLQGLYGAMTGQHLLGLPHWAKGVFTLLLPVGLLVELHTE